MVADVIRKSTCGLVDSLMKVTCCPLIWATLLEWRLQFVQFTCFHAFWHEIHQDWIDQGKYQKSSTLKWWWFEALNLECVANIHPIIQPGGWLVSAERQEPQFFISILTDVEGEAARFIFLPNQIVKNHIFPSGKRLYCPCLSFSEAVTKESLGLSREADEGEEEVWMDVFCI